MSSNEKMLGIGLSVAVVIGIAIAAMRKSGKASDVSADYTATQQSEENSYAISGGKTRRKKQNRNKSKRK
jgi:hypothetical protein